MKIQQFCFHSVNVFFIKYIFNQLVYFPMAEVFSKTKEEKSKIDIFFQISIHRPMYTLL